MAKVTLNRDTFKALASDTRLDILKALDGNKTTLSDLSKTTGLNKATLHEHLNKLTEAGLVKKKGREGHKWVYYTLTWTGESLLHPENTKIVVMFATTVLALVAGISQLYLYFRGTRYVRLPGAEESFLMTDDTINKTLGTGTNGDSSTGILETAQDGANSIIAHNPTYLYIAIALIILCSIIAYFSIKAYNNNKTQKL